MRGWFMGELGTDPRATYGDLEALDAWRTNDRLGDLALPTCAISVSEHPEDAEAEDTLAGAIAGSQRIAIEKAAHLIPVEQPDALAQQLGEFLADASAQTVATGPAARWERLVFIVRKLSFIRKQLEHAYRQRQNSKGN